MGMVGAVKFIEIGHFDLLQGSGRLREDLLPWLEAQAPCIVFIDEIGHMGLNAGQPTQVISWLKFLDELNQSRARIILIGATNNYTTLDRALIKHNRFGTVIRFDLPTFKERVHFFDTKIRDLALDPKSFNLKLLARRTYQAAYGDLTQVFDTAITLAKKNGEGLRQSHIEMAVDRRIRQLEEEFDTSGIAPDSIDKVAANLAGESLATLLLNPSYHRLDMIALTKIRPEYVESHDLYKMNKTRQDELRQHLASFGRVFSVDTSEEISHKTRNDLLMQCLEFTAGRAAEELLYGEGEHLWEYSIERYNMAIDSARWYLSEGRPAEWMSPEEVARYNNLATQLTAACKKLAYQLLQAHVPALKALINEIRDQRLLTADDALLVVKGKKNDAESKRILAELKKTGVQYMDLLHRGSLSAVVKNKPLSTIQEQASSAVVKALKG
jgi:ATP-dependent Zn protease